MTLSRTASVGAVSEPTYRGSCTASAVTVKPVLRITRIQRLAKIAKAIETGAESRRYGERADVSNTAWVVIGRYRDTNAQTAMPNATTPIAVRTGRRIFLRAIQSPVIASGCCST
jgi:hypothetical protein